MKYNDWSSELEAGRDIEPKKRQDIPLDFQHTGQDRIQRPDRGDIDCQDPVVNMAYSQRRR